MFSPLQLTNLSTAIACFVGAELTSYLWDDTQPKQIFFSRPEMAVLPGPVDVSSF